MKLNKLIKACKRKDIKAQKTLYETYKDVLYILCLKYCKNKEEAQDNLQDTFITIFSSIQNYSGKGSFEGWMKRITINNAIKKYKNRTVITPLIDDNLLEDYSVEKVDLDIPLSIILNLIQKLPDRYRLVFNLYEMDNYSHKEIAQLLSISEGTSKSNLHRAKLILKEKINEINTSRNPIKRHGW